LDKWSTLNALFVLRCLQAPFQLTRWRSATIAASLPKVGQKKSSGIGAPTGHPERKSVPTSAKSCQLRTRMSQNGHHLREEVAELPEIKGRPAGKKTNRTPRLIRYLPIELNS
jgi:hypothetical protein